MRSGWDRSPHAPHPSSSTHPAWSCQLPCLGGATLPGPGCNPGQAFFSQVPPWPKQHPHPYLCLSLSSFPSSQSPFPHPFQPAPENVRVVIPLPQLLYPCLKRRHHSPHQLLDLAARLPCGKFFFDFNLNPSCYYAQISSPPLCPGTTLGLALILTGREVIDTETEKEPTMGTER